MSKERKPKNKPDVPPEMAEAQDESGLPEMPGNLPPYLAYKPSPDSSVALQQLQLQLAAIDNKLRVSNHLQAHPMMQEMVLPAMLQLFDLMMRSLRDVIVHAQNLASWSTDRHVVPAVPVKLAAALLEHLKKARELHKLVEAVLKSVTVTDDTPPLMKETLVMADKLNKELDEEAEELEEEIEDETFDDEDWDEEDDEDEDEPGDEDDDLDDGDEDDDLDDGDEDDDLVEKKHADPDAEPLFK